MLKKIIKDKRFLILISCLSILFFIGAGLIYWMKTTYDPQKYDQYISEGADHLGNMEYAMALDSYLLAAEVAPRKANAYVGIVDILGSKSRFEDAEKILSEVEGNLIESDRGLIYSFLGDKYAEKGLYEEAALAYSKAFATVQISEYADLGALYALKSGDLETTKIYIKALTSDSEAKGIYEEYIAMSQTEADLYEVVKTAQKLLNEGYPYLTKTLLEAREDDIVEYWEGKYFLGRAYFDLGENEKAKAQFESAVNLGADDYALYWYLGRVSSELGDKDSSYKYYSRAVEYVEDEDARPVIEEYSSLLIEDGRFVDVENLLNQFYDKNWAKLGLMKAYWEQEKEEQFLVEADLYNVEIEDESEKIVEYHKMMVEYYLMNDEFENASESVLIIADVEGQEAIVAYYNGVIYKGDGEVAKARVELERSIDLDLEGSITERAEKELMNLGKES